MANMRIYAMSARIVRWIMRPYLLQPPLSVILWLHENTKLKLVSCHLLNI
uniref:Uncharacterized protein n=1 Tax=Setaria italica TaxID=4555 RepID=K3ZP88_SETIT